MKRKILIVALCSVLFITMFTLVIAADGYDYSEKATLADGTVLPVYDENQNPLIWYVSGVDESGNNIYVSVPNNRNEANANHDTYVTYTINTGWETQLENINFHIWNAETGEYETFTEETYPVVVVNLRGLTSFAYIHRGFKNSSIQYIYFHENLRNICDYFKGSTALRLVDLTACTNLTGGLGGGQTFRNCTNLHTFRLPSGASYTLQISGNYVFNSTAITEIVIPENVQSIGTDNFYNCSKLESIYILGNTTSLGKRNFGNCAKLTNVYILGANTQITAAEFRENFYYCFDENKDHYFQNIGKYFFFATNDADYLESMRAAIEAVAVVPYSEYTANPQNYTEGRYIISGTSICDVMYDGNHIAGEAINGCQAECQRNCGGYAVLENAIHDCKNVVTYGGEKAVDYFKQVEVSETCKLCGTVTNVMVIESMFYEKGYSAAETDSLAIVRGFLINTASIDTYKQYINPNFEYGVVVAVEKSNPLTVDENGNIVPLENGVVSASFNESKYRNVEIKIIGISEEAVDTAIVNTIYVCENGKIYYLNDGVTASAAEGKSYNSLLD